MLTRVVRFAVLGLRSLPSEIPINIVHPLAPSYFTREKKRKGREREREKEDQKKKG